MKHVESRVDVNAQKKDRWFVIASRAGVAFYEESGDLQFRLKGHLQNAIGRKTEKELDADRAGRVNSTLGSKVHALDRRQHQHEEVARKFALEITEKLKNAIHQKDAEELILVAEPHFLGILYGTLPVKLQSKVVCQIPKEIREVGNAEVRASVLRYLNHS